MRVYGEGKLYSVLYLMEKNVSFIVFHRVVYFMKRIYHFCGRRYLILDL